VALVARRLRLPIVAVGIPALAGLSVLHGLVPPHPGPLVAIDALGANLGLTLLFGLATAIPTVLVAGPLFAKLAVRWVPVTAPDVAPDGKADVPAEAPEEQRRGRVGVGAAVVVVLVPVVLMLIRAVAEVTLPHGFSHVNDAGFWLVKEYFGLTVGQTIKSWSMMETSSRWWDCWWSCCSR
jgi:GntP family gluconate:H+ symporter